MAEPRTPQDQIDDESAPLSDLDHRRLARVERSLERGLAVREWWEEKTGDWADEYDADKLGEIVGSGIHPECFPLTRKPPDWQKTEANYGFFDVAPIDGRERPLMGLVQQTFFDEPKQRLVREARDPEAALDRWQDGLRKFVLRYLIRLTGFHETAPYVDPDRRPVESWLRPFSWCPPEHDQRGGFGFSQLYYKRRKSGRVGKFRKPDLPRIDLRKLDNEFAWVVVGIRINDLQLRHPAASFLTLSIEDEVLAVMSHDFVVDDDRPEHPGLRGRYGFGYAVLEDPAEEGPAVLWQRPTFGFQRNEFVIENTGRILGRVTMVTDKLPRLLALDPWVWGTKLADRASLGLFSPAWGLGLGLVESATPGLVARGLTPLKHLTKGDSRLRFDPFSALVTALNRSTLGYAAKKLCISRDTLLRSLLSDFVRSQLSTIIASRGVWRLVTDWSQEESLPDWVRL